MSSRIGETQITMRLLKAATMKARGAGFSEKSVVENSLSQSLAIFLTAYLAPAICPFVIDPGYTFDHDDCISRVAQRATTLCRAAVSRQPATLDSIP